MTKQKFFRYCERAETGEDHSPLSVIWRMEYRGLERAVFLNGCWSNGCITCVELYKPLPGRQGQDCYMMANRLCEEAAKKYQRWLDEFLSVQQGKK